MTRIRSKIAGWLGFIAAGILRLFGRSSKPALDDLRSMEFKSSAQRLGLRFSQRIRDVFRSRWIRKS